jgi:hypothetical protein
MERQVDQIRRLLYNGEASSGFKQRQAKSGWQRADLAEPATSNIRTQWLRYPCEGVIPPAAGRTVAKDGLLVAREGCEREDGVREMQAMLLFGAAVIAMETGVMLKRDRGLGSSLPD